MRGKDNLGLAPDEVNKSDPKIDQGGGLICKYISAPQAILDGTETKNWNFLVKILT